MQNSDDAIKPSGDEAPIKPRRGWRMVFWGGLLLIIVLIAALPSLVAGLFQSPQGIAWLSGQDLGRFTVGRATMGWQVPVMLRDVVMNDGHGRIVAQVDSVTTTRSFWDMLTAPKDPLKLTLDKLKLTVVVKEPHTHQGELNVKEVVDAIQRQALPEYGPPIKLVVTNGTVEFQTPDQQVIEVWNDFSAEYDCTTEGGLKQTVHAQFAPSIERGTGVVAIDLTREQIAGVAGGESVALTATADRASLKVAQGWLAHYLGPDQPFRYVSGQVDAQFERRPETGWQLVTTTALEESSQPNLQIQFSGESRYSKADDQLVLTRFEGSAPQVALQLSGTLSEISRQQVVNAQGRIQTPGAPLLDLLPPEIRREVQITGMNVSDIAVQGALAPEPQSTQGPLTASMNIQWESLAGYGLRSTNGTLKAAYQDGVVTFQPINVNVNNGKLHRLPTLDLTTTPRSLRFSEGLMLENVALTEEVCRGWLQYISPTLADATTASGSFSLAMRDGIFILGQPEKSQLAGQLIIFDGKVRPGPLAVQLLRNVGQLEQLIKRAGIPDLSEQAFMEIPQEEVNFVLQDGRVYHDEFAVNIRQMRVSTSGSVGIDQTLALLVRLPIPDKWLGDVGPVLASLRGEAIELNVRGTFKEPQVDGRPIAEFGKRIGVKAATGLIERIIERRNERGR